VTNDEKNRDKSPENKSTATQRLVFIRLPQDIDLPIIGDATGLRVSMAKVDEPLLNSLAQIATNAWRARIKMVDSCTGEAKEEMKRVYRHIEAIFDALEQIELDTIDPTGQKYDSGMALKVVSFERTPGLSKEEIKETIKPSVKWRGQLIQRGEVIVGTPQDDAIAERKE